jgi:tRNA threonylcarbamoyl adenosine modification protein (Sua5/YciO/YrdC/YwlC family)/dephospho-CoA kinase
MVPGPEAMDCYCVNVPEAARVLAEAFWPGPLTIVLQAKDTVPGIVRAGGSTVGLRCPDHPLTLALLNACGVPLAAPSANPSGKPSPKTAEEVAAYFGDEAIEILDGGPCGLGRESTIIDMSAAPYRILRQGALPEAEIRTVLRERMTVFGITGGTGCGKTTALQVIGTMGGLVIDCDEVYHTLGATSADLREKLIARFGPEPYATGVLDTKPIGEIVFHDPAALAELNEITHTAVKDEIDRRLEDWVMSGGTLAAIDAIALIESGAGEKCGYLVGITAPKEVRVRRIMARDGITEDYARARIASQQPNEFYEQHCDKLLENAGTPEAFAAQCRQYFTEVLQHGKRKKD